MAYLNNKRDWLQEYIRKLQQRLRYSDADAVDCLEMALARERLKKLADELVPDLTVVCNFEFQTKRKYYDRL